MSQTPLLDQIARRKAAKETVAATLNCAPRVATIRERIQKLRRERRERREIQSVTAPLLRPKVREWQRNVDDAYPRARTAIRRLAGVDDNCPIYVTPTADAPHELGAPFVKYHWSNGAAGGTVYHPSTRRVEVGVAWLRVHKFEVGL